MPEAAVERPAEAARPETSVPAVIPRSGRSGPPPLGLIALRARPTREPGPGTDGDSAESAPLVPPRKPEKADTAPRAEPETSTPVAAEAPAESPSAPASRDSETAAVVPLDGPESLMGLTPDALTALLGQPAVVRQEAPAQIWQYQEASCVFDIFLYEEADTVRVAYFEARDHQAQKQAPGPCLMEILARSGPG